MMLELFRALHAWDVAADAFVVGDPIGLGEPSTLVVRGASRVDAPLGARAEGRRTLGGVTANREIDDILQRGADGGRITPEEALLLYTEAPFHALGEAADAVRRRRYPDNIVTYLIDRNINYTNVCVTACKFCAFYRAPKHAEGWTHPTEEILRRCGEAVELGATQVMLQGGHHPDYGVEYYEELFSSVKKAYPQLVIHSIGPQRDPAHGEGLQR